MTYQRQRPIDILTRDDLDTLLAGCGTSLTGTRNRALLSTLYFSGVRIQEALDLRPVDIRFEGDGTATLNVRCGKGARQRIVTLAAPAIPDLQRWLAHRTGGVSESRDVAVFCIHARKQGQVPGDPMRQGYVRQMLTRLADRTDLGKRLHAHAFRHAHASYLYHRGVPIAAIQAQLGHVSPITTTRYLASIGAHDAHRHVSMAFA